MLRRRRARKQGDEELEITAFMNLMVVLVPFLLITAVFSRVTIIDLNLPAAQNGEQDTPPHALQLEIVVRAGVMEIAEQPGRVTTRLPKTDKGFDYAALSGALKAIKARYPEQTASTILMEPEVPYEIVVKVMDTVRLYEISQGMTVVQAELFPDISLGDAPQVVAMNP